MTGSTISGTITTAVALGSAAYPSPLTITSTGNAEQGVYGAGVLRNDGIIGASAFSYNGTALYLAGGGAVTNSGTIAGSVGTARNDDDGGNGVYLAAGGTLTNDAGALITGGAGGPSARYYPGRGGIGVRLVGATLVNAGTIIGGKAGIGYPKYAPVAGVGVSLSSGAVLTNTGLIIGGASGLTPDPASGASGVDIGYSKSNTVVNAGTVIGGSGYNARYSGQVFGGPGLTGGYGADVGGTLINTGIVLGGDGVSLSAGVLFTNYGRISGGSAVSSGTIINTGTLAAGVGAYVAPGGTLVNEGVISGGVSNGVRADAVLFGSAGTLIVGGKPVNEGGGYFGTFFGNVVGHASSDDVLVLAPVQSPDFPIGTLSGLGTQFTNFPQITIASGASWALTGDNTIATGTTLTVLGGATLTDTGTLINAGIIAGGPGVYLAAGGTLTNIDSLSGGSVTVAAGGTLINTGTVSGGDGARIAANGTFTNMGYLFGGAGATPATGGTLINTGTIISGVGVYLGAGSTLTNGGTIGGAVYAGVTTDAVQFAGAGSLFIDPGAAFHGQVAANPTAADTLYFNAGSTHGTLSGIGTQLTNFSQITIGSGASWTLTGNNTIATGTTLTALGNGTLTDTGTLVNDGGIVIDPSTMTVAALTGTGTVTIEAGSTLQVQGAIASGETIMLSGSGAYLHLDTPTADAGSITNAGNGDAIDIAGVDPSTVTYASGNLLFAGGDHFLLDLVAGGTIIPSASADGTMIDVVLCFCTNTMILTPSGERPVQDLAVGDLITTFRGEARPIVWIGVGKVLATRGRRSAATPVVVHKGALAENVPNRDLRVTRAHGLWFDDALIPVEFLVNHRSIEWDDRAQEVELYHIELASHDVLVANGAPAESYRDDGNRWLFHNANSGWGLPPQPPCAPVLTGGAVVDAVWRRLLERAGVRPGFALTDDPDLHLLVDGKRVNATGHCGAAHSFQLLRRPLWVRIVSRAASPAELGLARDPRLLGVAIRSLALCQGSRHRIIQAADGMLSAGFHPFEPVDRVRWTDGDAFLPSALFDGFDGPIELVLQLGGTTHYPLEHRCAAA